MKPIPLQDVHREQLKEMLKYLFPEYPHQQLGGEYVSLSTTPLGNLSIIWNRIHWLELLMREGLRRIFALGRYDDAWMFHTTRRLVLSLMAPEAKHPITLFYEEYLKIRPDGTKDGEQLKTA